jgi:excisionase family DNA binding protein
MKLLMIMQTIVDVRREPVVVGISTVSGIFAVHRASVPAHIREIGTEDDGGRPFTGRKIGKWLITWSSIASVLGVDVKTVQRDHIRNGKLRRLVLSVRETAQIASVCEETILTMIRTRELRAAKLGNEWKIPVYAVADCFGTSAEKLIRDAENDDDGDVAV